MYCENTFKVVPAREHKAKYCSRECYASSMRKGEVTEDCVVEGCTNKRMSHSSDLCKKHHDRKRLHGSPDIIKKLPNGKRKYHPLYSIFAAMLRRCNNQNCPEYEYYGARGIKVCERWSGLYGFDNFLDDMGERPDESYHGKRKKWTLDRINNDGDYEPNNCKWSTVAEQCKNRRNENMVWNKTSQETKDKLRKARFERWEKCPYKGGVVQCSLSGEPLAWFYSAREAGRKVYNNSEVRISDFCSNKKIARGEYSWKWFDDLSIEEKNKVGDMN